MRAEASEQRKRDKLEAERLAQSEEEARATLAAHTPSPEELNALAWVVRRSLPRARPVEFAPHGADVPAGIEEALSELADEMRGDSSLHLHIAGHHTAEEEEANPRLSAMRAYAVGNALGMLGVRPSQLRAKGYHATVALTSGIRARLSIRSDRRVTVHAISEIRTRHPIAFAKKDASVDATAAEVLSEVAELLNKDPSLNLCIEGHTDEKDEKDPEQSVRLSRARAKAVQRHLLDLGVADDGSRLSCHGFGTTLPLHIKAKTEENRARNRRVQLLLVPDVRPEGSKPQVASRGAGIHLVRL
jgi:outer membrane protein OmpA-like peptidoglycan-associated protein